MDNSNIFNTDIVAGKNRSNGCNSTGFINQITITFKDFTQWTGRSNGDRIPVILGMREEIIDFLSEKEKLAVEIRSGVYDRLSEGGGMEMTVEASKGRRIRIYQLEQDSPFMMRFISLAEREKRGFEKPQQKEYALVYEGEVDTFSLEDVWEKFGRRVPRDFEGHALSISDVVEFSEEEVSRYFYVEPKGFAEITFKLE